jgi:hypothetical protein
MLELLKYSADNLLANPSLAAARRTALEHVREHASLTADSETLGIWRCVATLVFKQDGDLYSSVDARHGFPKTNRDMKSRMLSLLQSLSADEQACERLAELRSLPDPRYTDDQWRTMVALLELLPAAVAELQLGFNREARRTTSRLRCAPCKRSAARKSRRISRSRSTIV